MEHIKYLFIVSAVGQPPGLITKKDTESVWNIKFPSE
jgi:hypothetical protein